MLTSNVGSVVEFSPATREARVRFPDVAFCFFIGTRLKSRDSNLFQSPMSDCLSFLQFDQRRRYRTDLKKNVS